MGRFKGIVEEQAEEKAKELPEAWRDIPIEEYVAKGFKPYLRIEQVQPLSL
jgi:hypothetical protein